MEQDLVMYSVIIPVYNVELYLRKCLKSVCSQCTENMEIILIDDGSTDDSGLICREYEAVYSIVTYIRQENAGLGAARNRGLLMAQGKYVIFLDSDDYWCENCIEQIQTCLIEGSRLDIVYFDAEVVYDNENVSRNDEYDARIYHRKGKIREEIYTGCQFFNETYPQYFNVSACTALFRREFLLNNKILFPQDVLYEDNLFSLKAVLKADQVKYLSQRLYVRRYRDRSIMTSRLDREDIRNGEKIFQIVMDYIESEKGSYEEIVFRKVADFALSLAHSFWQKCSLYAEEQSDIRQIKENVYRRVYDFFKQRERSVFKLEEWGIFILFSMYLKKDFEDICMAEQILQREKLSSMYEFVVQCKKGYSEKVDIKLMKLSILNTDKKVGIYGKGNHTKQLLYRLGYLGELPDQLFIIDSNSMSDTERFEGYPVINIRNVPEDTELVLISSFLYEKEMFDTAKKYLPECIRVERMYQDEIREICWEWLI